jgi:hypothetical protein
LARSSTSGLTHIGLSDGLRFQAACEADGPNPPSIPTDEWSFSFGDGFLGTARRLADHFVTTCFVGSDLPGGCGASCCLDFENRLLVRAFGLERANVSVSLPAVPIWLTVRLKAQK